MVKAELYERPNLGEEHDSLEQLVRPQPGPAWNGLMTRRGLLVGHKRASLSSLRAGFSFSAPNSPFVGFCDNQDEVHTIEVVLTLRMTATGSKLKSQKSGPTSESQVSLNILSLPKSLKPPASHRQRALAGAGPPWACVSVINWLKV